MSASRVILIVENQPDWQEMLSRMLTEAGYTCKLAADLKTGLEAFRLYRPAALVLDLQLGPELPPREEFRGWRLAEQALRRQIPTIIVTAYASTARANKAFRRYKVIAFLDKGDLRQEDLVEVVSEAVEASQQSPPSEKDIQTLIDAGRYTFARPYQVRLPPPEEKVQRKLVLRYNHPNRLLSVTIEDERGRRLFSADSDKEVDVDVHYFGVRADEAWRSPEWRDLIKGIGQDLYARLFDDHRAILAAYNRAMGMVHSQDEALSLVFHSTRDALRLPIEFLYDGDDYLCLKHPMSRYLQGLYSRPPLSYKITSGQSLYLLLVASDTGGIPNVDKEVRSLRKTLSRLLSAKDVDHDIMALSTSRASHRRVVRELEKRVVRELENRGYGIWHYAGHGLYDKDSPEQSSLVFWEKANRKGKRRFLLASDIYDIIRNSSLVLAYLSCCLGSTSGDTERLYNDDFLGLADALTRAQVPTVIGFRWPISDKGAVVMAKAFYTALAEDFNPRRALWLARRAVTRGPHKRDDPTWASPILIEQS